MYRCGTAGVVGRGSMSDPTLHVKQTPQSVSVSVGATPKKLCFEWGPKVRGQPSSHGEGAAWQRIELS